MRARCQQVFTRPCELLLINEAKRSECTNHSLNVSAIAIRMARCRRSVGRSCDVMQQVSVSSSISRLPWGQWKSLGYPRATYF